MDEYIKPCKHTNLEIRYFLSNVTPTGEIHRFRYEYCPECKQCYFPIAVAMHLSAFYSARSVKVSELLKSGSELNISDLQNEDLLEGCGLQAGSVCEFSDPFNQNCRECPYYVSEEGDDI